MENKLTNAIYVGFYKVLLVYNSNELRLMDFNYILNKNMGAFESMKNEEVFKQFQISKDWDTLVWDNGFDICPDVLYEESQPAEIRIAS